MAFSLDYLYGIFTHTIGRLAHTFVQGNCLPDVMGQETRQYCHTVFVLFVCTLLPRSAEGRQLSFKVAFYSSSIELEYPDNPYSDDFSYNYLYTFHATDR